MKALLNHFGTSSAMRGGFLVACLLGIGLAVTEANAGDGDILARVGATELKADEVRAALEMLDPGARTALARDPALLNQVVRSLLIQRLVLQQALSKQWERRPDVITQLEQARQNTIVESYLESVAAPPPDFPSEADLRKSYEANKAALLVPRQFRLAQIFIALPGSSDKSTTDKARAKLDAARATLRQRDADFAAIARAFSEERTSADRGGEIGWLTEAQIQPEIRPSIVGLAKAAVSEPIQLADGWHILKTLDLKESYTPTFEAVRSQLARQLRAEHAKAGRQAYVAGLLKENPVAINELGLSEVLPTAEAAAATPARESAANRPLRPSFK